MRIGKDQIAIIVKTDTLEVIAGLVMNVNLESVKILFVIVILVGLVSIVKHAQVILLVKMVVFVETLFVFVQLDGKVLIVRYVPKGMNHLNVSIV